MKKAPYTKPYIDWFQISCSIEDLPVDSYETTMKVLAKSLVNPNFECNSYFRSRTHEVSILAANISEDQILVCKDFGYDVTNRGTIPRSVRRKYWKVNL
jgi:hypothetical protein